MKKKKKLGETSSNMSSEKHIPPIMGKYLFKYSPPLNYTSSGRHHGCALHKPFTDYFNKKSFLTINIHGKRFYDKPAVHNNITR